MTVWRATSLEPKSGNARRADDGGPEPLRSARTSGRMVAALAVGGSLADLDLASLGGRDGSPLHLNLLTYTPPGANMTSLS
jgi:hypothetical protein